MSGTSTIGSHGRRQYRALQVSVRRTGMRLKAHTCALVVGSASFMNGDSTRIWYIDGCKLHTKVIVNGWTYDLRPGTVVLGPDGDNVTVSVGKAATLAGSNRCIIIVPVDSIEHEPTPCKCELEMECEVIT